MKPSRLRTLLVGLLSGTAYAFLAMGIVSTSHRQVSIAYIFVLPLILGAIPVFFSTKEQLKSYWAYLLMPWGITMAFFFLSFVTGFEGMICLVIIAAPFSIIGSLGAFIFRLITIRKKGNQTPLYTSLFLPFVVLAFESIYPTSDQYYTVKTTIPVHAELSTVWENVKNVKDIQATEISTHFIHVIGIPKPLDGRLDKEGVGGVRSITWQKGIKFQEIIKTWNDGRGFSYDIKVDPTSIPPTTLDEHVMIGGRYFDVIEGSYVIDSLAPAHYALTLSCTYRVTTNLNMYSKLWADYILNDFNTMILEVIKNRCEAVNKSAESRVYHN